jgi:hypothetical protein
MNQAWKEVKNNWLIQLVTKFVAALVIASVAVIILRWNRMPPLVPLWYSRPWGTDQLAHPIWLFLLPLGGLAIFFLNLAVSIFITAEYLIFTQVLFIASFLVNFLSFITLIKIVFIIT